MIGLVIVATLTLIGVYVLALLACPTPDEAESTSDLWIPRGSGA